jgi:deoxyribodipyrimidine photo-lyase
MTHSTSFTPTRAEALERLDRFLPHAGKAYAASRNEDRGPGMRDNVSTLSPFIRHRLVTEAEVLAAVLARHPYPAAERFVQEVFWRTYWKGWLEQRPVIWTRYREECAALLTQARENVGMARALDVARAGETGIAGFDDWARELAATGYLHNHARMWFASIWIFTLKLPWQLGAHFFERHLLDGDPASNTLSWRWVAGVQTRGKAYLARAENIARFTGGRYEPDGLADHVFEIAEPPHPAPAPLPEADAPPAGPVALLLHGEDCHPESIDFGAAEIRAIGSARAETMDGEAGQKRLGFTRGALADAALRAQAHFGCPAQECGLDVADLVDLAGLAGADTILTPYAPVGPLAEALARARAGLAERGIRLLQVRRRYDALCWPHATRGYFAFRKSIPRLLAELQLV